MNINDLVTQYVEFRRTLGERCKSNEDVLRSFCRAVGPRTRLARIREKHVTEFPAGSGQITNAWHARYSALKGFFEFAMSHGHVRSSPLPAQLPKRLPTLVPYIYSRAEIPTLLSAIPSFRLLLPSLSASGVRGVLCWSRWSRESSSKPGWGRS